MFDKIKHTIIYAEGLISSTTKKTCEALGRFYGESGDRLLRILKECPITQPELVSVAQKFFGVRPLYLAIDDTLIQKMFSKYIGGTSDNYDSSTHTFYRSLCSVVAMVTDGKWSLPIDHRLWVNKELTHNYITKFDLAKGLILAVIKTINIQCVLLDGLYATQGMIAWFIENNIKFEMRFHSNRVITVGGKKVKIGNFFESLMRGKKRQRTVRGSWYGMQLYFTAVKRENKNGEIQIVYQVSNYKAEPRQHVRAYSRRWGIEKIFRTTKQHLGLKDCQVRSQQGQSNHIMNVFLAYCLVIFECREKGLKTPEAVLRRRKGKKPRLLIPSFLRPAQIFEGVYA